MSVTQIDSMTFETREGKTLIVNIARTPKGRVLEVFFEIEDLHGFKFFQVDKEETT